ncbi:DNA repair photolyase [Cupriavidus metallidurans]|jgi:DNA repair photolyase|uniref:PA0069 family radical SAM protein n=1 Tax=Cupriavidus metallidurans TaxID=119219 RepID=UPI0004933D54|nr:PA0069 family radical SAM protein [Cupriavidus metallidurans]AVA32874.1 radical SAM protein [Cupriavidus metallidurans]MDE4917058.1 PA0069 family radical SAM protein [Cupriavidus metallidurans]
MTSLPDGFRKGRGALSNTESRFDSLSREADAAMLADLEALHGESPAPRTTIAIEPARTIISRNQSPDVPFDQSINMYRGCEHGCSYCFARPNHAYLGLSPGLDFETKLFAKPNAATLLEQELRKKHYKPSVIALGTNTDPYQPIERKFQLTRGILEVLERFQHPVAITTKSFLVTRDIDILARMARNGLARVFMSVTTLDADIARKMEPRASTPSKRIEGIRLLAEAGVPAGVLFAPVIPALTDYDLENVLKACSEVGATSAGFVMLRLPLEVHGIFIEWLEEHFPGRKQHVLSIIENMRNGKHNDATFTSRMRGTGIFAELVRKRFEIACRRLGLNQERHPLRTDLFRVPPEDSPQGSLF